MEHPISTRLLRISIGAGIIFGLIAALAQLEAVAEASDGAAFDHDHSDWNDLLQRHVKRGNVDYSGLGSSGKTALGRYRSSLESVTKAQYGTWNRNQKLAFWINAYNAYTLSVIVDNMPVQSIMKLGGGNGAIFKRRFIPLGQLRGPSAKLSLNDVENRIIRPDFREPRIHFALVCAARSCPVLRADAYRAGSLSRQLEQQTRAFIRNGNTNRYDASSNTLHLSRIFEWYAEDFERGNSTVPTYVARYLGGDAGAAIKARAPRIAYLDYDWSLNGR